MTSSRRVERADGSPAAPASQEPCLPVGDEPPAPTFLQRWHQRLGKALIIAKARVTPQVTFGVRAMLVVDGKVLLVRHTYLPGFHLPGGGVDPGESAREAAIRELFEETGIVAERTEFLGLYFNRALANRDHVAVFVVTAHRETHAPTGSGREIAERGFFPLDDLPAATTPATRRRLGEVHQGRPPSDVW